MTREEFIEALMTEVNPWLAARHNGICGPWIAFGSEMSRLYLYGKFDSTARWSIDLNLCVDILNSRNAITPAEMIHGIILCLEARNEKGVRWSL